MNCNYLINELSLRKFKEISYGLDTSFKHHWIGWVDWVVYSPRELKRDERLSRKTLYVGRKVPSDDAKSFRKKQKINFKPRHTWIGYILSFFLSVLVLDNVFLDAREVN